MFSFLVVCSLSIYLLCFSLFSTVEATMLYAAFLPVHCKANYAIFILVLQVAPPGTVYVPYYGAAPPYQAYQGPYGGESSYGHPPPYAPPTAPPPTQK